MKNLYRRLKGKSIEELSGHLDECKERICKSRGKDISAKRFKQVVETIINIKVITNKGWRMKGCKHGK